MNQSTESEQKLNTQKMSYLCDQIMRALELIKNNKETYKTNPDEMLRLVKLDNPNFYNLYPRICRSLVFEDDISPLLGMIQTFGKVQEGQMSWNKANDVIQNALNAKYIDPVLNSEKLVKEREEKQKEEASKQKIIDITNS
jgi:hypothetical protein